MKSLLASRISSLRFLSTSAPRTLKNKVPEYQKLFQEDNGLPVHLKGGTIDAMMYRGTMILSVFGVGLTLFVLFQAASPKKNK
ncbi:cytochrome c oxidase subunit 7A1, mitochondrial isoform X2 [Podarcis muralis]|uniref:cytochrome c oxidase subunit 7A2, mitochondrial-like n=1 Tax=Podarcis muralis TaxID=64176 RepID=UPI00109F4C74|nr:cytochrome c oxidase subunit 7A2, mitochondrial-like [Podarcis muralis]